MRLILGVALLIMVCGAGIGLAQDLDMVDPSALAGASSIPFHPDPHDLTNGQAHSRFGIFGIDSIPNFNDHFLPTGSTPPAILTGTGTPTPSAIRRRWAAPPPFTPWLSPSM